MLAQTTAAALLMTMSGASGLSLRHPGMLSVRFEHLYGKLTSGSACPATMRVQDDATRSSRKRVADVDEEDAWMDDMDLTFDGAWMDDDDGDTIDAAQDDPWNDDDVMDDDNGDEMDGDYGFDDRMGDALVDYYDEDEILSSRPAKNARKQKRAKSEFYDEDDIDDDELAEFYTWR